jgi:hypothetical protein
MLKNFMLLLLLLASALSLKAQTTQTVRGKIVDEVSKTPLIGASVVVDTGLPEKILGGVTDADGNYRVENVPLGRQTLKVSYIGYEEQIIPNVIVTAGKEVVMNFSLTESINQLNEVVVTGNGKEDKTATNNDLAVVSARSFNVDDTKRYAGALGDPSRMAANFAGVVGGNDSRNDIVVRGNAPTGMLWQLEGLNIPNPNHFGALVSTGGPVSMLNNNNLDKSDFMTSAFPAQYGNANAGVFDIRLRDGNNEKHEFLGQVGFNGFELGAEGPFSKNSKASFIVNYRYSTLGVFQALGIQFGTGTNTPLYQDLNFKLTLPTSHNGKWTVFGIGGMSKIDLLGSKADLSKDTNLYGDENQDSYPRYKTGIFGVSYERKFSDRTFVKFTGGLSGGQEGFYADSLVRNSSNDVIGRYKQFDSHFNSGKYSFVVYARTKYSSKNSLTYGAYVDVNSLKLFRQDTYTNLGRDTVRVDVNDRTALSQGYVTWRHRFTNMLSLNTGVHAQYYSLNKQFVAEPRVSLQYLLDMKHSISIGYGIHNQTQNFYTSFVQTRTPEGNVMLTNKNLGFTTSHHYVLTYDWNISESVRLKAETYYQTLSNVPVERFASSFSALNTGGNYSLPDNTNLVNKGSGRNYGLELTLERFFSKGYYFLITTSLFDSKYKGNDGVLRNTAFNTQYVANTLAGKEWRVGKNKNFLSLNIKLTTIGGKYLTPIDYQKSQQFGRTVYKNSEAFSVKQDPYFRTDVKISYRKEYKRSTLEVSLDLQNITNHKNIFSQSYDPRTNVVVTQYQQSFFPVPYMRFTF